MKNILLLLAFLSAAVATFGQMVFTGTVAGLPQKVIQVEKPFQGKYFPGQTESVELDATGRFEISVAGGQSGFLHLHLGEEKSIRVFVEPGTANGLSVNMADFDRSLSFYGPKAVQNQYLQRIDRSKLQGIGQPVSTQAIFPEIVSAKDIFNRVVSQMGQEKKALRKAGKIAFSPDFMLAVERDIDYYYLSLFSAMSQYEWAAQQQHKASLFTPEWGEYWSKIFTLKDLDEGKGAVSEYYLHLLNDYVAAYRLGFMQESEFLDADTIKGEQFLEYDRIMWKYFTGEILEYNEAALLSYAASLGKNEPILAELFLKYKMDFPESPYLPLFEKSVQNISIKTEEISYQFPAGIVQVGQHGEIANLKDLLGQFKGKTVYMDIWATWCSPCLFEFRQSEDLERLAAQYEEDLVLLFVSVDDDSRLEKWRKIIEDNHLKGYHLLADFALRDELINTFGDGSNLALPKYLIFDKKGKLVEPDAKQPSQNTLLIKQLEQYLRK